VWQLNAANIIEILLSLSGIALGAILDQVEKRKSKNELVVTIRIESQISSDEVKGAQSNNNLNDGSFHVSNIQIVEEKSQDAQILNERENEK
jgi:hypothetical protein